MKTLRPPHIALPLLLALTALGAAADAGRSRAEVIAELVEARRTGDLVVGNSNQKLNEIHPELYPPKAAAHSRSRAEVLAELGRAQRSGELYFSETGQRLNEMFPRLYPPQAPTLAKTRAEVQAELAEARRTGAMEVGQDGRTLYERAPERYAAARAEQLLLAQPSAAGRPGAQ